MDETKGDLWYQLAHIVDPHDIDEEYEPGFPWPDPALVEKIDQLEAFFSNFAELWRRGADKEICEMGWQHTVKSVEMQKEIERLKGIVANQDEHAVELTTMHRNAMDSLNASTVELLKAKQEIQHLMHSIEVMVEVAKDEHCPYQEEAKRLQQVIEGHRKNRDVEQQLILDQRTENTALRERHTEQLEAYLKEIERLKRSIKLLEAESIDITARSIAGRMETWDLIDRMIPYLEEAYINFDEVKTNALLAEIEEKRTPHG